ncbi:DUF7507 domain-containing protein [Lysobacter sp. CA196]|uniref:DUF7507 domain-containing protein n=1 Tax=Lysobacter sp. CA196 TaxID=3455606 RepID=UPI003F8D70EF
MTPNITGLVKTLALVNDVAYVTGQPIKAGDKLTYRLTFRNEGGDAGTVYANNVDETVPPNTVADPAPAPGSGPGQRDDPDSHLPNRQHFDCSTTPCRNWRALTVPANNTASMDFIVRVVNPLPAGTNQILNNVAATIGRLPNGTGGTPIDCAAAGNDCTEVTPIINVVKTLVTGGPTAAAGETLVYQIQLTNNGTTPATIPVGGVTEIVPTATTAAAGDSFSCAVGAPATSVCTNTAAVTVAAGGGTQNLTFRVTVDNPLSAGTQNIANTVALPQFVDCASPGNDCSETTPTSQASLTLVKTVTNDNGGTATIANFPLAAAGPTPIAGVSGSATVTNASVAPGVYALSETTVTGYTAGAWSCTGGSLSGSNLTLADGDVATCTINNNDQAAALTLVKTVTNDNGGTAVATAWTLQAAGPTNISGATGAAAVTNAPVSSGNYTLSETGGPSGYTASTYSCVINGGAAVVSNNLTLAVGDTATCTINNNDQAATLTLVKTVTNDNGGTSTVVNFPLAAAGPTPISGVSGTAAVTNASVSAGTYALSETNVAGYTAGPWGCTAGTLSGSSLTLASGVSATCTIVNDDVPPPTQTIVKAVTANADQDGTGTVTLGDTLTYTIRVTNTSTTTNLDNVVISDSKITPTGGTTPCASVAPGGICTLIGSYTVVAADVTAGNIVNTATSTSSICPVGSTAPTCTTTLNTPVSSLSQGLTKTVTANADEDGSGTVSVGDTLTYAVTMTNTSTTSTLTNVVVSDNKITPSSITCATVAPGDDCVLSGTYVVTATDASTGSIVNTATVTSPVCPAGSTDPGCTTTVTTPVPPRSQTLVKALTNNADEDGSGTVSLGDTLTYTVTMTNTSASGNLSNVVVSDSKIAPSTITCATVAPSLTCVLTGTYVVTVADVTAGNIVNTATSTSPVCPVGSTDPACTTTVTTPVASLSQTLVKALTGNADEDRSGTVSLGDTLTYTVTVTNTSTGGNLNNVVVNDNKITPNSITCATMAPGAICVLTGTYVVTAADVTAGNIVNTATSTSPVCAVGSTAASCTATVNTPVIPASVRYAKAVNTAGPVVVGDTITYTLSTTISGGKTLGVTTLTDTLGTGLDFGAVTGAAGYSCNAANPLVCTLPAGTVPGTYTVSYTAKVNEQALETVNNTVVGTGTDNPTCQGNCTTSTPVTLAQTLRVIKQASPRDVKIGDLVRYTVTVENTGTGDAVDATLVDTPPAGFSFVDGSLAVADRDGVGRLVGTYPIQVDQVDIAAGERATFTYLLRVGAGVRAGIHSNSALMRDNGQIVSNVATAEVQLIADPLLDHALILGTVFDDRDSDGWQDSAAIDDARVQGGFAAEAYVPNSTTVDRGNGPKAEPDASSPMLHGIVLGSISARQSDADPVDAHRVVISQRLKELSFTDDFALTTKQGVTVRMDAAGTTRIERSGDAAKNLSGAAPTVERRVSPTEGGYLVDYIVRNTGVDERGIPGVRIASIEGLLMETDQYGRYHLEGVDVGTLERGRNFILKVDPSTLPPGSVFTTDNPLTRRVTPGLPVRFDWGVKLPAGLIEGGEKQVEMELGEVFFAPGSAEVRASYLPAIEKMAEKIKQHRGGEVVISANGDSESLAFDRASAVKAELVKQLPADLLQALKVSVRGNADDPGSLIVGLGEGGALLGTVLFDTDKSNIKPQFEPLLDKVAAALERMHGGVIAIVGHTDVRASYQYNTALGMRRAKAVYDALAQRLSPEVRAKVRVESSNDPTAPVDVKRN